VVLSTGQKGAIAETAVVARAIRLGVHVYRPVIEGGRYDVISISARGCFASSAMGRSARRHRPRSLRRGPNGIIKRGYTADEIDAIAAYCLEFDRCYFVPFDRFPRRVGALPSTVADEKQPAARRRLG
jgi:PD-(D/E)XK nuclease superfamily protein